MANHNKYFPRLELNDGTIRKPSLFYEFDDFESAESFLLYHELAPLDSNDQLSETVQYCAELLLQSKAHPSHLLQLHLLAKTLKLSMPALEGDTDFSAERNKTQELNWQETDLYYSAETIHGRATIVIEKRGMKSRHYGSSESYKPVLHHETGATMRGSRFYTFEGAEEWVGSTLQQLSHPIGGKTDVNNVEFTLDVCIKLLLEDSDPTHYVRINRMKADYSDIIL